jgi:nicotinamide mononucleotide transporter
MNIVEFAKGELSGWGKYERIIFPLEILLITLIAIYMKDKTAALISAICGICATITAGKGKISCYMFGMISNICYSYISYKNYMNPYYNMLY